MIEIMFRGKRKDNNEWAYGFFVQHGKETYIFEQQEVDKGIDLGGSLDCCEMREVIPETVGIWTGLTDKDGIYIFDGDIIDKHEPWNYIKQRIRKRYEIKYIDSGYFYSEIGDKCCYTSVDDCEFGLSFDVINYSVIGNIHDNPELLKGE